LETRCFQNPLRVFYGFSTGSLSNNW
jgi:hypothetical protein